MKIVVYPHLMEIGGSQLNAVELAARTARAGHEVVVFAPDGELVDRVRELGLEHHRAPVGGSWPTRRTMAELLALVRHRDVDLVHGYEWGPAVELAYGPHLLLGTPMVVTVLSMDVPGFLPTHVPLVVGTGELADEARVRHDEVHLMEPPIDDAANAPGDPGTARRRFGVAEDDLLLAVVCRLTADLQKVEGVLGAIDTVGRLARDRSVRLLVAGDGPGLPAVRAAARAVNAATGRETVLVLGALLDPRPAYEAADVVLGMGSSALKGMAFAKPLVVQGAEGFWELLTPQSVELFLRQGWYGHGSGSGDEALTRALRPVLDDASLRVSLGQFGRRLVAERFSLDAAAERLEALYRITAAARLGTPARVGRLAAPAVEVAKYKAVLRSAALRSWTARRAARPTAIGVGAS